MAELGATHEIPTIRSRRSATRDWLTDCTICRRGIFRGQPYVWLRMPTGLCHEDCARRLS